MTDSLLCGDGSLTKNSCLLTVRLAVAREERKGAVSAAIYIFRPCRRIADSVRPATRTTSHTSFAASAYNFEAQ